ncbi:CHAT domain-containing protein [Falsiroseomonas selenitidurans]|uniref:CHAT domain-containing protein n=1 Tax=Falsiroseomonas selenitidurans TaxID=2716335 RepID=A0ABX1E6M2_9PROT|nr:CHAT domain-containing tetratricopeptide repeat protein [Falsiroseomonas selenitidurans]NKC32839.1 CHAT domain-containing protein [Falsiroseomonas selenitidurans]
MVVRRLAWLALLLGAACTSPPPDAYVASSGIASAAAARPAGADSRGEACLSQDGRPVALDYPVSQATEAYCGGYSQPAARVFALIGPTDDAALDRIAAGGIWRSWLDQRLACGAPQATRLGDGSRALVLACTRRQGGWQHVALVTQGAEGPVLADGIPTALVVIERLARGIAPGGPTAAAQSEALELQTVRLAARAFGAGDVRDYEQAMNLGQQWNAAENHVRAEDAYRAALAIQERVLGAADPNTVGAVVHLALNLSNQQRFREAEALFLRADGLATRASDPTAPARLAHYRGLHALNQGQHEAALRLLTRAEQLYRVDVPPSLLNTATRDDSFGAVSLSSPIAQTAIVGLAEAQRGRATVLARSGAGPQALALLTSARGLLSQVEYDPDVVGGRSLRTEAAVRDAARDPGGASDLLARAADRFGLAAPGERAQARTLFLLGQRRAEAGQTEAALAAFRSGAEILARRRIALETDQVLAYLDALGAQMARQPAAAASLQREMFGAAQYAQRGQTSRFLAQAAARLATASGDGRVADAVRRLQDAERELRALFAERDAIGAAGPTVLAELDARIDAQQRAREEAESEVAAAAPAYRQLLLTAASPDDVARVLRPKEVLVQILLGPRFGFVLAVQADGAVQARKLDLGEAAAAALVARIRRPMDQGGAGDFDTAAAHALYQGLLAPVAPALAGAERLVVVPDGPLLSIPFGVLLTGPAEPGALRSAPWLLRQAAIVHATSPQALVTLRNGAPASTAPRPYIGFGDFNPPTPAQLARSFPGDRCAEDARLAEGLGRLPGTRAEVEATARFLNQGREASIFGADFTAAALRRADLGQHRIIHLATHALLPGELSCVQEPSVVVSPPPGAANADAALLRASEVLTLRLDADLVILSACNTAGPATGVDGAIGGAGEALSGLARSFFFAGARGLLVTHWPVDDRAAAFTVAYMMRQQEASRDSAAALRDAQLVLIQEAGASLAPDFAHPFYWAGFAMIGDGRLPGPQRVAGAGAAIGG